MLPFPLEKGYLPQGILSQVDCLERQPLIEGGLAQGSEIKSAEQQKEGQSILFEGMFFFSWY